jgi:hypothetical protein
MQATGAAIYESGTYIPGGLFRIAAIYNKLTSKCGEVGKVKDLRDGIVVVGEMLRIQEEVRCCHGLGGAPFSASALKDKYSSIERSRQILRCEGGAEREKF